MSAGKGDKPRPINKKEFDENFGKISWTKSQIQPKEIKTKKGKTIFKY